MAKGENTFISREILEDPDIETPEEMLLVIYLWLNSNIIGISPWRIARVKSGTRLTKGKCEKALASLIAKGKAESYANCTQIWYKSVTFYRLFKGKHSVNQLKAVQKELKRTQFSAVYGQVWANSFTQLYATKYQIVIPITPQGVYPCPYESESESYSESESEPKPDSKEKEAPVSKETESREEVSHKIAKSRASVRSPLEQSFEDWEKYDKLWYERLFFSEGLKVAIKDVVGCNSIRSFIESHMADLRHDIYNRPEKFKNTNMSYPQWRALSSGYLKLGIEEKRMGDGGFRGKGMSLADERAHEAKKRLRVGTNTFDDGPGITRERG